MRIKCIEKLQSHCTRHRIAEVTEGRVSELQAYSEYIKNSEFETRNIFER